jgi:hypothetical protein
MAKEQKPEGSAKVAEFSHKKRAKEYIEAHAKSFTYDSIIVADDGSIFLPTTQGRNHAENHRLSGVAYQEITIAELNTKIEE